MATLIQGGCSKVSPGVYKYIYALSSGVVTEQFTASQVPKIGDSISAGVLVPLVGHLINQDQSKWLPVEYDEWPEKG